MGDGIDHDEHGSEQGGRPRRPCKPRTPAPRATNSGRLSSAAMDALKAAAGEKVTDLANIVAGLYRTVRIVLRSCLRVPSAVCASCVLC